MGDRLSLTPQRPLHHAAHGPPPPSVMGEELPAPLAVGFLTTADHRPQAVNRIRLLNGPIGGLRSVVNGQSN